MRPLSLYTHGCQTHTPFLSKSREALSISVLDLTGAFFCIPLHPDSQYHFAFEWRNPDTLEATRYTWTVLPQGFPDSPHLFGNVLVRELRELALEKGTLL